MPKAKSGVNWRRLIFGALVATVICFMTDGFLHEKLLKADWMAVFAAAHTAPPPHETSAFVYFGLLELGRGFLTLFVYAVMRARFGAGPMTAVYAGGVSWLAFSVTGPAQFIPLGILSCDVWLKAAVFQLMTSVLAGLAGAYFYKEGKK